MTLQDMARDQDNLHQKLEAQIEQLSKAIDDQMGHLKAMRHRLSRVEATMLLASASLRSDGNTEDNINNALAYLQIVIDQINDGDDA